MEKLPNDTLVYLSEIQGYAREMRDYMLQIRDCLLEQQPKYPPLDQRKRWNKREVLELLNMSESTYKRNLKVKLLIPMKLNGDEEYFEEDLLRALEESRRRGRV